uniref:Replication factor C subunit 3 n=2 Tax=Lygus hesperus TaxID=30085 RepID=A0A0A9YBB3_LYGHE
MAIANQMYSGKLRRHMVLELNASNDRGIDVIRNQIKEFASSVQLVRDRVKLIILDEADSMTRIAQFALRRIMEKFTRTTRFIIIANYINKIIPAIQSRCTTFRFSPLHGTEIVKYLQHIADSEHLPTESAALQATTQIASGDMRRCIHILQSCFAAYHSLTLKVCLHLTYTYTQTHTYTYLYHRMFTFVLVSHPLKLFKLVWIYS